MFKTHSIEAGLKPVKTTFFKISPLIRSYNKLKLKQAFSQLNIPFPFEYKEVLGDVLNPKHIFTKRLLTKEEKRIEKIIKIREGISQALEKTDKYRQDRVNKKPINGLTKMILDSQPFLAGKSVQSITIIKEVDGEEQAKKKDKNKKINISVHVSKKIRNKFNTRKQSEINKNLLQTNFVKKSNASNSKSLTNQSVDAKKEMNNAKKELKEQKKI